MILWLALLVLGALAMWVAVPVAWLYIGSKVQEVTDNVGAGLGAALVGSIASIAAMALLLGAITRRYQAARVRRGLEDTGGFPLEVTLVCTAGTAAIAFAVWFLGFAGAQPFPMF
jgi:hypothetical protein